MSETNQAQQTEQTNNDPKPKQGLNWQLFGIIGIILLIVLAAVIHKSMQSAKKNDPLYTTLTVNSPLATTPPRKFTRLDSKTNFRVSSVTGVNPEPLRIYASRAAYNLVHIDKEVNELVEISPKIEGIWKLSDARMLTFTVKGDWPVGQKYKVTLAKELFGPDFEVEDTEFSFITAYMTYELDNFRFHQDPVQPTVKRGIATIHFSHPVNPESFEKKIKLSMMTRDRLDEEPSNSQNLKFTVTYSENYATAFISTENLTLPEYEGRIDLDIEDGFISAYGGKPVEHELKDHVSIPGMLSYFRIESIEPNLVRNDKYEPEQVLVFESSARVSHQDLAKHMEVYKLPKVKPKKKDDDDEERYNWYRSSEVSEEVLKRSDKITLTPLPSAREQDNLLSFRFKEEPGEYYYFRITKGLEAYGGYKLIRNYNFVREIPEFPTELKIMAEGSLLSLSGERKLSILARDLEEIRFSVKRILPGQLSHFINQNSGNFTHPSFWNSIGFEDIAESHKETKPITFVEHGKTQYTHFDFDRLLSKSYRQPRGLFYLQASGKKLKSYYYDGPSDNRLVLVTDLGIIEKKNLDETRDLFVQSISTGKPVAGAKVQVMGRNGLTVLERTTDENGLAKLPSTKPFHNEKSAIAIVVTKGEDLSFLPLGKQIYNLNYSRYDVGGVYDHYRSTKLEGYMFSDRGIYRPGEKVNIGYIVKHNDWERNVSDRSLRIKVYDPKGSMIRQDQVKLSEVGLQSYQFDTGLTWPTGGYRIDLELVKRDDYSSEIASLNVMLEEFLPDRMKISANFNHPTSKGWLHPEDLKGDVLLQNLFGTPATNRKVNGEISLTPSYPSFWAYRNWNFHDPMQSKRSYSEQLGSKITDDEGKTSFELGLDRYESASYLLKFMAEGFEADGGRSVMANNSVLISPMKFLVGYQPEGSLRYIKKDTQIGVKLIAIDQDLKMTETPKLTLDLYQFKKISTLVKQDDGSFLYQTVDKQSKVESKEIALKAMENLIDLKTDEPGSFLIEITDQSGLKLNKLRYSVAGTTNLAADLEKNAELQVKLDKTDYNPGEMAEISILAPYPGAGLITVERDKVYSYQWFRTNQKSSIQRIRIPSNIEGNGYVNVTFMRSLDSREIFMSPLSTGVAPFSLNKERRVNKIELKTPESVRPGETLTLELMSKHQGKALVFAVDEGILQVAKYNNPDPLKHFYKKKALEVDTRQIIDMILPEYSHLIRERSAQGGGAASMLGKNLNPFKRRTDKAVAYWSGLIDLGPEGKTLTYEVPDHFSGKLRVIAVAVSPRSMDATSEKTTVKGDFVLSPNVPTFVAPGDKLTVSVGVANLAAKSGKGAKIEVSLKASDNVKILGESKKTLTIDEGKESLTRFEVEALSKFGNVEFQFSAKHGQFHGTRTATASLRPARAYATDLKTGILKAGDNKTIEIEQVTYDDLHHNEVSVSLFPLPIVKGLTSYLRKYPYGCTEQVTSKGFPNLIFGSYPEFLISPKKIADQVQGITEIYAARQLPDGGLAKWSGYGTIDPFHSTYAAHYLTEAKERGHQIPKELMEGLLGYLKILTEETPRSVNEARVQAYAAYILTRNEVLVTDGLTALEEWLKGYKDDDIWKKDVLMLYMASAYKVMQADKKAEQLLSQYEPRGLWKYVDYRYGVYDDRVRQALFVYLMSKHFPERLREGKDNPVDNLTEQLAFAYNSTSASLGIMALESYLQMKRDQKDQRPVSSGIQVLEHRKKDKQPLSLKEGMLQTAKFSQQAKKVTIVNGAKSQAYYTVMKEGFALKPNEDEISNGIEIFREYLDEDGQPLTSAKIGQEVTVRLRGRSLQSDNIPNIATVDLLPGGFEVVLDSIDRQYGGVEYVDAREDRVIVFRDFDSHAEILFEYKIKAINRGTFEIPPVFAESMYDLKIGAQGLSGSIKVE